MTAAHGVPRAARAATVILCAAVFAACSTTAPTPPPITTSAPEATPAVTEYDLGATVWYEGLEVHVDKAIATLDPGGGPVEVDLRLINRTDNTGELDAPVQLVVGTTTIQMTQDSDVPLVPPNGSMPAQLTFNVQGTGSVDGAYVEVGAAPKHVAKIPLATQAASPLDVFQPVELKLSGSNTAIDMKISLHTGELRWDLPDWSEELADNLAVLTLTYDVSYVGSFAGGFAFTGDNVALRLPDGTVVSPRPDGHSQSVELIGPHKTQKGLFSRFEVPSNLSGKCQLLVRNGGTQKTITFTIGG